MDHSDHVMLLRDGVTAPGSVWADLGSGTGAFSLALADLLGPAGVIYSAVPSRFLGRIYSALSLNQEERPHD